jgi:23S rRNA pseudouridine1911/1915/1917 synthase
MYGKRSSLIGRQALHAQSLSFIQPGEEESITVLAPIPQDFQKLIEDLKEE